MSRADRRAHARLVKVVVANTSAADRAWFEGHPDQSALVRPYAPHELCWPGPERPCMDAEMRVGPHPGFDHVATIVLQLEPGSRTRQRTFTVRPVTEPSPGDEWPMFDPATGAISPLSDRDHLTEFRQAMARVAEYTDWSEDDLP